MALMKIRILLKNKIYVGEIWASWRTGHDDESIITNNKRFEQSMF